MNDILPWLLAALGVAAVAASWWWRGRARREALRRADETRHEAQRRDPAQTAQAQAAQAARQHVQRAVTQQAERLAQRRAEAAAATEAALAEARRRAAEQVEREAAERSRAEQLAAARALAERQAAERAAAAQQAAREAAQEAAQEAARQAAQQAEREAERQAAELAEQRLQAERAALKAAAAQTAGAIGDAAGAAGAPRPRRVMIVDDSKVVRVKTGRLLEQHRFAVCYAGDGLEAAAAIERERPDLIITDVEMPAMDGFELTRRLRANAATAQLPVIMITAADDKHRDSAERAGVSVLLGKPYADEDLIRHIREALGERLAAPLPG